MVIAAQNLVDFMSGLTNFYLVAKSYLQASFHSFPRPLPGKLIPIHLCADPSRTLAFQAMNTPASSFVFETLRCDIVAPHVWQVTLNRPEVGNAINTQMGLDLLRLWTELTSDPGDCRWQQADPRAAAG